MGNSESKAAAGGGAKITKQDRAILDLKIQRDKIRQYQRRVQTYMEKEREAAKTLLARGERDRAKTALRRMHYQATILQKTDAQLETLEGLVSNIEFSQIEVSVMHGLAQGNAVLKEIHKEMTVESVEKLMEDTAEAQAYQREVDEALQSRMTAEDEEAVSAELLLLEREALQVSGKEIEAPDAAKLDGLPSAPNQQPIGKVVENAEEEVRPAREAVLA
jgi:charged multivesicular body protein 6